MAIPFDSPPFGFLSAFLLLAVAIWSWRMSGELRASVRVHLRFGAVLLAALAAALPVPAPGLAFNVMLLTASAASAALALTFCFRQGVPSWLSALALVAGFAAGLTASLAAMAPLALAAIAGAAASILSFCPSRTKDEPRASLAAIFGAVSLVLGGLAMMDGGLVQAALFFAAALGLMTRALQKPVEQANARIELLVGGKRA